ncbi:MAG: IMP cyclohydrolase [Candidatus Bathyarchaeota archaeon]|nr:MAG: IMP cyclohydrolase [Candidatus Bathyarchaeota archaeon]
MTIGDKQYLFCKVSWDINGDPRGLRYGTNPHQTAAMYVPEDRKRRFLAATTWKKWGKNGPSATNIEDGYRALRIVSYFDKATVAVMKHLNPTGVGISYRDENADAFEKAWSGDPRAAYGSTIGFNSYVDKETAEKIVQRYVECLFAPSYSPSALKVLQQKVNLRVAEVPDINKLGSELFPHEIKVLGNSVILEQTFATKIKSLSDLKSCRCATKRKPEKQEIWNMLCSWWVCSEKRSNGVVIWRDDRALAVGTGQQDRIGAIEIALERAKRVGHSLDGSALASDGFMLQDNIEPLAKVGVTSIIQPGGSRYDENVIEQCEKYDISMLFTGERVFRHF